MPGFRTNCSVRQGLALALQPSENAVYVAYTPLDRSLGYRNPLPRPVTDEPIPSIESLAPLRFVQGQTDGVITIRGRNFIPDSVVQIGDAQVQPRQDGAGLLRATLPASVTRSVGTYQVSVINPLPGGGQSNLRYVFVDFADAKSLRSLKSEARSQK